MNKDRYTNDPSRLNLRQRLQFLAKDSLLYGGAAALNKAFGLITLPILSRHFSIEEYGVIDYFSVFSNLLVILFIFGQDSAVARYYYEYKNTEQRKQVISQSLIFQLILLCLLLPVLWIYSDPLSKNLNSASEANTILKLVILQLPFLLLINFSQNILKWTFSRFKFLLISIGSTIFTVSSLLVTLFVFELDLIMVFVVFLFTRMIFGILGLFFCRQWLSKPSDSRFLKEVLLYAWPYGVICTIGALMPAMERTFIVGFFGDKELGFYAVGTKIALLISLPIQAFQVAWGPFSLSLFKESDSWITYNWVLKSFLLGIFTLVLGLTIAAEPVIHILASERYYGASVIVFPLSAGLAIKSIGWITSIGINLSKKSYLNLYSYFSFLVISIIAMYFLLHLFGFAGVAWGSMIGYLTMTVVGSWLAQRAYPMSWAYSGVICMGIIAIFVGGVSQFIALAYSPIAGVLTSCIGLSLFLLLGWKILFNQQERGRIISIVHQIKIPFAYKNSE